MREKNNFFGTEIYSYREGAKFGNQTLVSDFSFRGKDYVVNHEDQFKVSNWVVNMKQTMRDPTQRE